MEGTGLCKGTKDLIERKFFDEKVPTFEKLYKEATLLQQKKEKLTRDMKEKIEKKEMADATFKPQINSPPKDSVFHKFDCTDALNLSKGGEKLDSLSSTLGPTFPT